jgi:hypothetical protein
MPEPIENYGRTPAYWRKRAEEARLRATEMTDAAAEAKVQVIARMYDHMADRAAKRKGTERNIKTSCASKLRRG